MLQSYLEEEHNTEKVHEAIPTFLSFLHDEQRMTHRHNRRREEWHHKLAVASLEYQCCDVRSTFDVCDIIVPSDGDEVGATQG